MGERAGAAKCAEGAFPDGLSAREHRTKRPAAENMDVEMRHFLPAMAADMHGTISHETPPATQPPAAPVQTAPAAPAPTPAPAPPARSRRMVLFTYQMRPKQEIL